MNNVKTPAFIHLSDTHIGSTREYLHRGLNPYKAFEKTTDAIRNLSYPVDFILHTGDVCGDKEIHASREAYIIARDLFSAIGLPVYFIAGNHDDPALLSRIMPPFSMTPLRTGSGSFFFDRDGVRFIGLDARVEGARHGLLNESDLEAFEAVFFETNGPSVVFLHYPPLPVNSPWMDRNMLVVNGAVLHSILRKSPEKILAVLFGHIHQPLSFTRDGVLYSCCGSTFFQFATGPSEEECRVDEDNPPGFSIAVAEPSGIRLTHRTILQGLQK